MTPLAAFIAKKEIFKLSDFDYPLPKELIAQYPCAERSGSRLLVLVRKEEKISHRNFKDIVDYFSAGDCLVLNNTKVISARLIGRREIIYPGIGKYKHYTTCKMGGGKQEIFLLENLSGNTYRVLARPARRLEAGAKILFDQEGIYASVLIDEGMTKIVEFQGNGSVQDVWHKLGQVPLPPYIKREPEDLDKERYQTVFAQIEGATAAPTAGLHFTEELLETIRSQGVHIVDLTLHISYGTFAPVKTEDIREHKMHKEYFILPESTAKIVNQTKAKGKKVFAVGTTTVRVLETCAQKDGSLLKPVAGFSDLFIYPPYRFKIVDGLLTNFHFPKSTLLMLVSAFAGRKLIFRAYQEAIERKYRFFSYGDAMFIL